MGPAGSMRRKNYAQVGRGKLNRMCRRRITSASKIQEPGWKGLPIEAGMLTRIQVGLREISTSTTMVAT